MNANRPAVALYERANRPLFGAALLVPLERIVSNLGYDLI